MGRRGRETEKERWIKCETAGLKEERMGANDIRKGREVREVDDRKKRKDGDQKKSSEQ